MLKIEALTKDINFIHGTSVNDLSFNDQIGFLKVNPPYGVLNDAPMLVGFVDPQMVRDDADSSVFNHPITQFADLPKAMQTIDAQGKGVGTRVYNVREAFGGSREPVQSIDVYAFQPLDLVDWRQKQGTRVAQVMRHGGRILRSKLQTVEAVVEDVHSTYGDAGAVLMKMPPNPERRSKLHEVAMPEDVTPQFIIIRSAMTRLYKIGETTSPW